MEKKRKRKGHSKINEHIKRNMYTWRTRHPQVVQSPISNDCLKVVLDAQSRRSGEKSHHIYETYKKYSDAT